MINKFANVVKGLSADAVEKANSGHPGLPIGCAEIGSVLFADIMNHDPEHPKWPNRDRFVLSAGHGSVLLYSLLHLTGYKLSLNDLKNFRQLNSQTPGHPEYGHTEGVETTTGPLGQGFSNAVGMAISEKILGQKYNTEKNQIIDHYTYTLLGDGCMMEGITSEAASYAGHLGLGKLIAIYDDNDISIAGNTDITFTENVGKRFEAYNWHVINNVDGHNIEELKDAFKEAKKIKDKPTLIIAKTKIACGAPTKECKSSAHGAPLGEEEIKGLKKNISLPPEKKFYISDEVKKFSEKIQTRLSSKYNNWKDGFNKWAENNPKLKENWEKSQNLNLPPDLENIINEIEIEAPMATRNLSGEVLRRVADELDYLIGGSADLAPSNKTYLDKYEEIQRDNFNGRNFRFGVREHAMAGIANGISVYGGLRPFVSTFLVFSDYMKPAIRMAALMKQPNIYIFTHDSIYVGEDGPTHQPIEHLESLRVIPNLDVIRPADLEETKSAWIQALNKKDGPTALILSRQALPSIKKDNPENMGKGAYFVNRSEEADINLIATGSEVSLALETAKILAGEGEKINVVSVLNRDEFSKQSKEYREKLIPRNNKLNVIIEAGVSSGWHKFLNRDDLTITMEGYGLSGPGVAVAEHFGFEAKKIANKIKNNL
ncbi:transketolase [Halanaerobium congolense]|uniref:Transketolase n=1 Tax=Halanaerobium congolense TaxID=54121 RepID=A0A1I0AZ36_9FIRM|nr:transketolase [Halanaerobium congolense]PTX16549.1 transketolase [Halanaerobium congolense]SDF59806.1 transketolase [Halanaerobium congolense]SES99812.1 transketolase [Halanaerobium congolense]SFP35943.1 transketolase [Halanaerobium congolense]